MSDIDRSEEGFDGRLTGLLAVIAMDTAGMPSADQVVRRLREGRRPDRTLRRLTLAVAATALVIVAIATIAVVGGRRSAPIPLPAVAPIPPSPAPTFQAAVPSSVPAPEAVLPGNGWIAYANAALGAPGSTKDLGLVSADGRRLRVGNDADKLVACPAFSPDGHTLAYRSRDQVIFQAIETGGAVGQPHAIAAPGTECPVWAPSGNDIAVGDGAHIEIYGTNGVLTRVGGPCPPSVTVDFRVVRQIAFSPDGARIAVSCNDGVRVIETGGHLLQQCSDEASSSVSWAPDGTRIAFDRMNQGIWVGQVGGDGNELAVMISSTGNTPIWSPGGGEIAWQEGGRVVVAHPDGMGRRYVGVGGAYGFGGWSPDGRDVLRMVDVGEAWDLVAVDVATNQQTTLLHAVPTGSARSFGRLPEVSWQPLWSDR
jgi:dipeptidyl aminopeptidase/acylaminoacyl peptidase